MVPLSRGIAGQAATGSALAAPSLRQALSEASGHTGFWLLTAGFFVCGFHLAFISVHLPDSLRDKGMAPWLADATLALTGLGHHIGTSPCGGPAESRTGQSAT